MGMAWHGMAGRWWIMVDYGGLWWIDVVMSKYPKWEVALN